MRRVTREKAEGENDHLPFYLPFHHANLVIGFFHWILLSWLQVFGAKHLYPIPRSKAKVNLPVVSDMVSCTVNPYDLVSRASKNQQ